MTDASFEDGAEQPLRLLARGEGDLTVLSALVQDAVLTGQDLLYRRSSRRFSLLLNRFRWEDAALAKAAGRKVERVRSVLDFSDVIGVGHQGITRDADTVLSLLSVSYESQGEGEADDLAGPGAVVLTFAGDGAIRLEVECLEVELRDVTRPYAAPSGHVPDHGG